MGYYTAYYLTASVESNDGNSFPEKLVKEIDKMNVFSERDFEYGDNTKSWYAPEEKWYEWEKDMRKLSAKFPDVFFELTGNGEESDDLWKAYFKGGMMQWAPGEIVYDDFSPSKLEKPKEPVDTEEPYSYEY